MLVHFGSYGQNAMQLSIAGGGVVYIILGASAVFLYLRRERIDSLSMILNFANSLLIY